MRAWISAALSDTRSDESVVQEVYEVDGLTYRARSQKLRRAGGILAAARSVCTARVLEMRVLMGPMWMCAPVAFPGTACQNAK